MKKNGSFLPLFLFALLLGGWQFPDPDTWHSKVDAGLLARLEAGEKVECLAVLRLQASGLGEIARGLRTKVAKGHWVFGQLQQVARRTQGPLVEMLRKEGIPFRSFYLVNALYLQEVDLDLVRRLATLPEIAAIQANPWTRVQEALREPGPDGGSRHTAEWGVAQIHAPEVWDLGITGEGVVVGNQDTGVRWDHATLKEKYRGYRDALPDSVDHNYNWHDAIHAISPLHNDPVIDPANNPCGLDSSVPCDDNNHGTYTVGISVGDDGAGNQIGVAPGARWMACRNMERGYGSPATYIECFEFFLAPTDTAGLNPNPALAPHVINNSWSCPEMEGCNASNWALMEQAIDNLRAAGVVVVVSAGNDGPSCGSVNAPAAMFSGAFTVGATNRVDTLAQFSSRGPVSVDGSDRLKPDVVAPGVGIRSGRRNGTFLTASGTSAAGPHVAGLVALMISANPDLAGQVDLIEQIIRETTQPAFANGQCNGMDATLSPNPLTGYGRVDALQAVRRALELSTATANPGEDPGMEVYPNPTRGLVYLRTAAAPETLAVEWFDAAGRRILAEDHAAGAPLAFDLSPFAPGVFWCRIRVGKQLYHRKVLLLKGRF